MKYVWNYTVYVQFITPYIPILISIDLFPHWQKQVWRMRISPAWHLPWETNRWQHFTMHYMAFNSTTWVYSQSIMGLSVKEQLVISWLPLPSTNVLGYFKVITTILVLYEFWHHTSPRRKAWVHEIEWLYGFPPRKQSQHLPLYCRRPTRPHNLRIPVEEQRD